MYARLSTNHRARYRNPLAVVAGEKVILGIRDVDWPEFIWATDPRGRSGWIHQGFLDGDTVVRDYDAREIDGKLKAQASIQGEAVRVSGAKRDVLQEAIALVRKSVTDVPLQFNNFRD